MTPQGRELEITFNSTSDNISSGREVVLSHFRAMDTCLPLGAGQQGAFLEPGLQLQAPQMGFLCQRQDFPLFLMTVLSQRTHLKQADLQLYALLG